MSSSAHKRGDSGGTSASRPAATADQTASGRWFWPGVLGICIVGGVLRFGLRADYLANNPLAGYPIVDALTYWNWAGRIAAGQLSDGLPFFSAPLYPYLLGIVRACGGELATVYAIQILLDLATAALLAWIARLRCGAPVGLLAAALFLLMLEPASFCLRVLTSTLQFPLICLAWLAVLAAQRGWSLPRGVLAGAAIGLLALSYPPAMLCLPVFGAWWWWNTGRKRTGLGRAAIVVGTGLAVISPATIHNYYVSGEFFAIQSVLGINFRQGNAPGAQGNILAVSGLSLNRERLFAEARHDFRLKRGREGTWKEINNFYRNQALAYWREDPVRTAGLFARKAYWFLTGQNYGDIYVPALEIAEGLTSRLRLAPLHTAWLILPALAALAVWLRRANTYGPELMLFGLPLVVVMVFWYSPRYRAPAIPVIVVAAAWALWQAAQWRTHLRRSLAVATSVAAAFALGTVNRAQGFDATDHLRALHEYGLARASAEQGNLEQALERYRKAAEARPGFLVAGLGAANVLAQLGQLDEARERAGQVVRMHPESPEAHNILGWCLAEQKRLDEAKEHFERALQLNPGYVQAVVHLGNVLAMQGEYANAEEQYRSALRANPINPSASFNLASVLARQGSVDEAIEALRQTLRLDARFPRAHGELANHLAARGDYAEAAEVLRRGCRDSPDDLSMANALAWLLATCPRPEVRDGAEAVRLASRVCEKTNHRVGVLLDTLAAAYAEAGRFDEAVRVARRAVQLATAAGNAELAGVIAERLALYERRTPFRAKLSQQ